MGGAGVRVEEDPFGGTGAGEEFRLDGAGRGLGEGGARMGAAARAQGGRDGHHAQCLPGIRGEERHADRGHVLPHVEEVLGAVHLGPAAGAQGEGRAVVAHLPLGEVPAPVVARHLARGPQHPQPLVGEEQRRVSEGGRDAVEDGPCGLQQGGIGGQFGLVDRSVEVVSYAVEAGPAPGREDLVRDVVGQRAAGQEALARLAERGEGGGVIQGGHDASHRIGPVPAAAEGLRLSRNETPGQVRPAS